MQLIDACISQNHQVRLCSPCQINQHHQCLVEQGLVTARFEPNDSAFDQFIGEYQPDLVFFDRFMIEEQFSWRVRKECPNAVRILDTIDLHSLRRTRQTKVGQGEDPRILSDCELHSPDAIREIAAIYRSDLSLIISGFELALLKDRYGLPTELIEFCPFFYQPALPGKSWQERTNFVFIGNFNHPPNLDSCHVLADHLWARIRKKLDQVGAPPAELHIYGAYPSKEVMALDNPSSGFRIKGWAKDALETLTQYRINLAPLRFGAGIKGKISDGWAVGTPCVASSIAAEGMHSGFDFGGSVADDWEQFAEQCALLYSEHSTWNEAQNNGATIIDKLFSETQNRRKFIDLITTVAIDFRNRRENNFIGAMLWHHLHRSTEYMSRWIEAKAATLPNSTLSDRTPVSSR